MKNLTRIIVAFLACIMLLSCFVGCGSNNNDTETDDSVVVTSQVDGEIGNYTCELPSDLNYGDKEITIISRDALGQSDEFFSENISGSIVSNAVYKRNTMVKERLGVQLDVIQEKDNDVNFHATVMEAVRQDVTAQLGTYDIITAPAYTAFDKVLEGLFYNLNDLEYLNLDKYYWAQGFNDCASVGEAQYFATGSIALSLYRFMYVTVYNNQFFKDSGLEDIYDKVKNNTWTMEEQYKMISNLYVDDGKTPDVADDSDTYGFVSGARTSADAYLAACDMNIVSKDSSGYYTYVATQEKFAGVAEKMLKLFYGSEGSYIIQSSLDNTDNALIADMFIGGKVAMASMMVRTLETTIKTADFEYSIAPLPKYDTNQENFGTYIQDQVTIMALPNTISEDDRAMLGAVMECFADESYKNTYLAYFETALSYQYLQNAKSIEMLQLIYESIDMSGFVACYATPTIGWNMMLRTIAKENFNSIAYQFGSRTKNAVKEVEETNQKYRELLENS